MFVEFDKIENLSFLVRINKSEVFRSLREMIMASDFVQKIFFGYLFFW